MAMTTKEKDLLVGRKAICQFLNRSWDTIHRWIHEEGMPAAKVDGCWEAIGEDLRAWKREMILRKSMSIAKDDK